MFPTSDQDKAHPTFEWEHRPWMRTKSAPSAQSHLGFHHPPMDTAVMTLRQPNQMVLATKPAPLAANLLYKSNRIFLHQLKLYCKHINDYTTNFPWELNSWYSEPNDLQGNNWVDHWSKLWLTFFSKKICHIQIRFVQSLELEIRKGTTITLNHGKLPY